MMTRDEHLAWAKARALEYLDTGDLPNAFASLASDLTKHDELCGHAGLELGTRLMFGGHLGTPNQMRAWIEGFR